MGTIIPVISLVLNVLIIVLVIVRKNSDTTSDQFKQQFSDIEKGQQSLEQRLREDMSQSREEINKWFQSHREELSNSFNALSERLITILSEKYKDQMAAFDTFQRNTIAHLTEMAKAEKDRFDTFRSEFSNILGTQHKSTMSSIGEMSTQHKGMLELFSKQIESLTERNDKKLEQVKNTVEKQLTALQEDNNKKIEQMRATVDEKLESTLEKRLGESFKLVSERLEQVHKGLGEMQTLASGVGDLKKVLTNVKTRGTMGEIQLDNILEQVLSPEQYEHSVAVKKGSSERVDFAIKLPGKDDDSQHVYLPIDSKFPMEDYQRLVEAQEAGDLTAANEAAKLLEVKIKTEAKSIQEKYINPPYTTDFAIMFLPIEGLFAEVLRRSGLWDTLQRDYRVMVTGPTTVLAILNSLQMGFRTLAIQRRSSEVWRILGAVKNEFGKFGEVLAKTQKKLQEASHTIDQAAVRTRAIGRKLRDVEEVPAVEEPQLLAELNAVTEE